MCLLMMMLLCSIVAGLGVLVKGILVVRVVKYFEVWCSAWNGFRTGDLRFFSVIEHPVGGFASFEAAEAAVNHYLLSDKCLTCNPVLVVLCLYRRESVAESPVRVNCGPCFGPVDDGPD